MDPSRAGGAGVAVERNGGRQRVEMEGADRPAQALFDGHPPPVAFDDLFRGGVGVVGDEHGGFVVAEAGDEQLPDRHRVGRQGGGLIDHFGGLVVAVAIQPDGVPLGGLQFGEVTGDRDRAGPQGQEPHAAFVECGELGLGGEPPVEHQLGGVGAGHGPPVVAERQDLVVLAGLGQVGVGIHQGVGGGVLGEEGQHRAGALAGLPLVT
ncbi:hypothetical protein GCM10023075_43570 [Streptosporangium album]